MTDDERQLLELMKARCFRTGEFTLASGGMSHDYLDLRMASAHSEGAYLIGEVLYERTRCLSFDALGGLQVGAVPLTAAAAVSYHRHRRVMEGFWVRDKAKGHGTAKTVEGGLSAGLRAVIVEDVATKGESALKAVDAVRALGCEVVCVLALVDRLQGARELLRDFKVGFDSVYTVRDFGVA